MCVFVLYHNHSSTLHSFIQVIVVCDVKGNLIHCFKEGKESKREKAAAGKRDNRRRERKDAYHLLQLCSTPLCGAGKYLKIWSA